MTPIYLASGSPQRRRLMRRCGVPFRVVRPRYTERVRKGLPPARNAMRLALGKTRAVKIPPHRTGIVIGADTLVAFGERILGKARSDAEAARMLRSFSGRSQWVYTGVALRDLRGGRVASFCEKSKVTFRRMSEREIRAYVRTGEYRGKAGAFGLQGRGARYIARVEGSRTNVVGLPVERLKAFLRAFLSSLRAARPRRRVLPGDRAPSPRNPAAAD